MTNPVPLTTQPSTGNPLGRLTSLPVSLLGLALFRAWVPALMGQSATGGLLDLLHDAVLAVLLLAAALLAPRIAPLARHRWPLVACGAAAFGAWTAFFVQDTWGASPVAQGLLTAFCAAASALFILQWCEIYARLPVDKTALVLGLSFVLGKALGFVLDGMAFVQLSTCLLALPFLCLFALARARGITAPEITSLAQTHLSLEALPWGIMALIGLYYLVSGMCLPGAGELSNTLADTMTVVAGAALVIAVLFCGARLDLSRVCKSPVAVLCCVLLLIPFVGAVASPLAAACTSLSSSAFELVVFLMMCDLCRRCGLPAVFVFGIEESLTVFKPLGTVCAEVMGDAGMPISLVVAVAVGILAVATLVLFNRSHLQEHWGIGVLGPGGLSEGRDAREHLETTCERLSNDAGLTPREREALGYLVQGFSAVEVAQLMGVAKGTAKAHCEHIYTKLGIHGRDELTEMVSKQ